MCIRKIYLIERTQVFPANVSATSEAGDVALQTLGRKLKKQNWTLEEKVEKGLQIKSWEENSSQEI